MSVTLCCCLCGFLPPTPLADVLSPVLGPQYLPASLGASLLWFFFPSPAYGGIVFFFFLLAHSPGLFSPCYKIVLESGEKSKLPECWRGLCTTSKAGWKKTVEQHREGSGERQTEGEKLLQQ